MPVHPKDNGLKQRIQDLEGQLRQARKTIQSLEEQKTVLEQSEKRCHFFADVLEKTNQPFAVGYADGRLEYVNPAFCDLVGYTEDELYQMNWSRDLTPPRWREAEKEKLILAQQTGESQRFEKEYIRKDGKIIPIELLIHLLSEEPREPQRYIAFLTDLTQRKQADEALWKSESLFRKVFEILPIGLWIADKNGTLLSGNPAGVKIWGGSPLVDQEKYGVFQARRLPSRQEIEPHDWALAHTVNKGVTVSDELLEIDAFDGVKRVILNYTAPVLDENGRIQNAIVVNHDVTEWKRAEEELHEREVLLNEVERIARIGGWEMDLVQGTAKWTGGTHDIVEIEPGEPIPGPDEHVGYYLPEYRALVEESMEALIERDVPLEFEAWLKTAKGNLKWCRAVGRSVRENGQCVKVFGTFQDITQRKKAQEELLESERKYRRIVETSSEGIWQMNGEFTTVYVNDRMADMLGYKPEEMVGRRVDSFMFKQDLTDHSRKMEKRRQGGCEIYERRFQKKDGTPCWCIVSATALHDEQGGFEGSFAMFTDITDRKTALEALRESEERWKMLIEHSPDHIVLLDENLRIQFANRPSPGLSMDDILGARITDFLDAKERSRIEALLTGVFQTLEPVRYETSFQIKESGTLSYESLVIPRIRAGEAVGLVLSARDITERKTAEKLRESLEDQLRHSQKMEALGTLSGGIAHDFNNILSIILGNCELAVSCMPKDSSVRESLSEIRVASLRARDVVRQLLSFSRKSKQNKKPVAVGPVVEESVKLIRASIPATVDIQTNIQDHQSIALADPTQLHQIMINLCTNASHSMPDEGGVISVGVQKVALGHQETRSLPDLNPGDYLKVQVRDSGQGMTPEVLARIFDPYFTTKEIGKGSGLGLSVVHGIVRGLHGSIQVESRPEKGTDVAIYIPAAEPVEEPESKKKMETPVKGSGKILFVDDEEAVAAMGGKMLQRLGYDVRAVSDSQQALEEFRKTPDGFDLVVTDMTMPNMAGDRLSEEILRIRPDCPIIICTGFSEKMDKAKALELGIAAYVHKPITMKGIAKTIQEVLKKSKGEPHGSLEVHSRKSSP